MIVGYGNPLRGDDRAGLAVAEALAQRHLPGVEVRTAPHLPLEWLPDLVGVRRLLLIDAAVDGACVALAPLAPGTGTPASSTHYLTPATWSALARQLYGATPEAYLLTLRGEQFELGTALSAATESRVATAVALVAEWLTRQGASGPPGVTFRTSGRSYSLTIV